jgi:hypothetical protein
MNSDKLIAQFVKERNEALFSLDEEKIRAFYGKWGDKAKLPTNPLVFWAGIHKAICNITSAPEDVKAKSRAWLKEHGFKESIG